MKMCIFFLVVNAELEFYSVLTDSFLFCLDKYAYEIFRLFNALRTDTHSHTGIQSHVQADAWQQPKSIANQS